MVLNLRMNVIRSIHKTLVRYLNYSHSQCNTFKYKHNLTVKDLHISNIKYYCHLNAQNILIDDKIYNNAKLRKFMESKDITSREDLNALLQFCGKSLSNEPPQVRSDLCKKFWENLIKNHSQITLNEYNTYIQNCTDNNVLLDGTLFVQEMDCEPSQETYKLLIENNCRLNNLNGGITMLTDMKYKKLPMDKRIFDVLVFGHAYSKGLEEGEKVINTMKDAQLLDDADSYWNLLKGLISRESYNEFLSCLEKYNFELVDEHFLDVLLKLGETHNHNWLPKLKQQLQIDVLPRNLITELEDVCVQLISRECHEAAIFIFSNLVDYSVNDPYGLFLLKAMLQKRSDAETIIKSSKLLKEQNPYILEYLTEYALRKQYFEESWQFLSALETKRPHYFWPILLHAGKDKGELGLFEVINKIQSFNVALDAETLEFYCLPYCDMSNTNDLLQRFKQFDISIKNLLSSIAAILLRKREIAKAAELCDEYDVILLGDRLLKPLAYVWYETKDNENVLKLLQKIYESDLNNMDTVGLFLLRLIKICKTSDDCNTLFSFLKLIESNKLKISASSHENILNVLNFRHFDDRNEFVLIINKLLDISMKQDSTNILHPKDMNIDELECHLTELESKQMETRGVLRKLIIENCRLGKSNRVEELLNKFSESGYKESAGIKGIILYTYIQNNHLNLAMNTYNELKDKHSEFTIDDFKIVDLATMLVKNGETDVAIDLIEKESRDKLVKGGKTIQRNCWKLLSSINDPIHIKTMFNLLIHFGYCNVNNILLGPLVKVHLLNNDIEAAANEYINLVEKYKCTPLQLELLRALVKNEKEDLLQKCLDVTSKVHGAASTRITLLAALAENELQKPLTRFLMETKQISRHALNKRLGRWVTENKLHALETLAAASLRLPSDVINLSDVHLAIMKIHASKNDCESAVKFWQHLLNNDIHISDEVHHQILTLLERCKYKIPDSLLNI